MSTRSIMIVDDDPGVLRTAGTVLRRQGYDVHEMPDGHRCLEAVRAGFRGVVLMDIMMPGMSGWMTIRALVAEGLHRHLLICMLTARPTPGPDSAGLEGVVFDYLPKPFDNHDLTRMAENASQLFPS